MKIFITGICGFLGHHIALNLAAKGFEVKGLYYKSNPPESFKKYNINLVRGDILNIDKVKHEFHNFDFIIHTAALISNLDLIITTDTSIAHLAGAMGKKTWVLLSFYHDWRWLLKKTNSYWYQYTKLFRSKKVEDWNNIFEKVINELKKLLN